MVGYPEFIMNATKLDKVFNDVGKCGTVIHVLAILSLRISFCATKTLNSMFISLLIPLSFSSRWCQNFTSKM